MNGRYENKGYSQSFTKYDNKTIIRVNCDDEDTFI